VTVAPTSPTLFARLLDGAATDPDGVASFADAVEEHRRHRAAAYEGAVGLLVVRASTVPGALRSEALDGLEVCVVADTGVAELRPALEALAAAGVPVRRVDFAVARRGEDPVPGVRRLIAVADELSTVDGPVAVHAEIPLSGGLIDALDLLADAGGGERPRMGATFRIGGLAAELFPTPATLAAVVCACRDRGLPFTVNAGLHRAARHNDPETGFTHHGALNLLAACLTATTGATVAAVADRLAVTDAAQLSEALRPRRDVPRPLWAAMTSCRVGELIADLTGQGLLPHADV
jgi:hypothetical protein